MSNRVRTPAPPASSVEALTFGCRLNAWESEVAKSHAEAAGRKDLVIVNTCAVTNEAVRQARQAIRRTAKARPDARIVVTGCAAQIDPDAFAAMPEVAEVVGNHEKLQAQTWADPAPDAERVRVADIMAVRETAPHLVDGVADRARAYVQVQNGCDHRCTFCIIPYGRGNARSVPSGAVVDQVRRLVETGHQEVVLTGVDVTSWGDDLPGRPRLGSLVRRVLQGVPELFQLRLSSLDAVEIDDALFDFVMREPRLAPHLHLSLQAGDDLILKRMKRRHLRADAVALTERLRAARPDIAFGADLIVGFPTETEAQFENTLALVADCGLAYVHVFPYSARPGTPAARMPQVDGATIKARAARLRSAADVALGRHLAGHVGREADVLIEKDAKGRLADFSPVSVVGAEAARPGAVIRCALTAHDGARLTGLPLTREDGR